MTHRVRPLAMALLALIATGCGRGDAEPASGAPSGANASPGARGAGGAGGASDARAGGGPSLILSASDVAAARRDTLEESVPLTGDLRPIETVDVRARIEGDLVGLYVREGERVRAGQLLARFEASEEVSDRESALAARASATSALSTAEWNLEQSNELFTAGAIPEQELKAAHQSVIAARALVAAADARVRVSAALVGDTRVLAPITGIVEKRLADNGERIARGAPILTLVRTDVLELAASVPARSADAVRVGQTVRFEAGGRDFTGRVVRASPTIDPATRAITVYVQVPNPNGVLKGGSFATGRVIGRSIPGALVVPSPAIRAGGEGAPPFVYRIEGDRLAQTPVRIGVVDEAAGVTEVLEGLKDGDRVIIGNVGTLGRGLKVQIIRPDARGAAR